MSQFEISLIVLSFVLLVVYVVRPDASWFSREKKTTDARLNDDASTVELISASRAFEINTKDPLIVSRDYFTEKRKGPTGDWTAYYGITK